MFICSTQNSAGLSSQGLVGEPRHSFPMVSKVVPGPIFSQQEKIEKGSPSK